MKKILALLLALVMVLALAACGGGSKDEPAAAEAPAAEAPAAAPAEAPAAEAPAAEGDDLAQWKDYLKEYAVAGAPNAEEGQTVAGLIDAAATVEDVEAIPQLTVLFENVGVLTYDAWIAAGKPAADAVGIGSEADNQAASGEPSGEASAEPAGDASGEPSGDPNASEPPASAALENTAHGGAAGATSEADYQAYLKAWLDAEKAVNSTMTDDMKAEFVALIDALDFETFPGDMLFNGMLTTGSAMTYDEFVAADGVY